MIVRMDVNNTTPAELFQGTKQYRVPIWQRQYTWRAEQHEQLWHDLLHQYRIVTGEVADQSAHFLGSFVLATVSASGSGVMSLLVIDGQQRMTTLMLMLCALRDTLAEQEPEAREELTNTFLLNPYKQGEQRHRLRPTLEDRGSFDRWVAGEDDNGARDAISEAYRFFRRRIAAGIDSQPLDLRVMVDVVTTRLAIVDINSGHGDNAHRIFQSLNGTGVGLNKADLLRNYIFMLLPTRSELVYEQVWRPMEELIGVDNLELLARVDLQRRGMNVKKDDIFRVHQQRLGKFEHDEDAIEAEVRDLGLRARHLNRIIHPAAEPDAELREGLARLQRWGAQTSYPLLMVALDLQERDVLAVEDLRYIVTLVESYLVRRQLAMVPPNALNKIFVQILPHLPQDETFPQALHRELSRRRLNWPDDERIRTAVRSHEFYETGRWHQRKLILERLERSYGHPELIDFAKSSLTIEHIMPQKLSAEWRVELEALGQDADEVQAELIHTLGNVTLTAFNGTLSNKLFERKQQIYGNSHLELNKALTEAEQWGRDEILARADDLATRIISIWPAPLPNVDDHSGGFDWSRIEAAVALIPEGRWTSYGDLAEFGGTAAQPVGNHCIAMPPETNAYRVLNADGSPSPGFRWRDPADDRDVLDVLAAEGVAIDAAGRASKAHRLSAADLAALLDEDDEQDAADDPAFATAEG